MFEELSVETAEDSVAEVHVVKVRGALMHRRGYWFDSYEGIEERVASAIAGGARRIILDIDSPGGLVSGAFDAARSIRKTCGDAGVELQAFVDAKATSAGYAIASAASYIGTTRTAELGSIGVICPMMNLAERNKMNGLSVQLIKSGDRKGDGWPDVETADGAVEAKQKSVDTLADEFFALVSSHGWVGSPEQVRAMQAGIVHGVEAVAINLASEITTLEKMIAGEKADGEKGNEDMPQSMKAARASLKAIAEGDNEEEAKKAKAALAAMDSEDDEATDDDDSDDGATDEDSDDDASDDDDDASDDDDSDDEASASTAKVAAMALARVHKLEKREAKKIAADKMSKFLGTRPDLPAALVASLKKLSLKEAKEICEGIEKGPSRETVVADVVTATGVQGSTSGDEAFAMTPEEEAEMDRQMGLGTTVSSVVETPYSISFGVQVPEKK